MNKKILALLGIVFFLITLLSCSASEGNGDGLAQFEDFYIPVLLNLAKGEGTQTYSARWDLQSGVVTQGELIYTHDEILFSTPVLWDGANYFVFESVPSTVSDQTMVIESELVKNQVRTYYFGGGVKAEGAQANGVRVNTIIWQDAGKDPHNVVLGNIGNPASISEKNIITECEFMYATVNGDAVIAMYFDIQGAEALDIYFLTYDYRLGVAKWSSHALDRYYVIDVATNAYPEHIVYADGKIYLTAGTTFIRFDVASGEATVLDDLVEQMRTLLPSTSQVNMMGITVPIGIGGSWGNTVIVDLPCYAPSGAAYTVFFSIAGDDILGAISVQENRLITYDNKLKQKNVYEGFAFSAAPLLFPKG